MYAAFSAVENHNTFKKFPDLKSQMSPKELAQISQRYYEVMKDHLHFKDAGTTSLGWIPKADREQLEESLSYLMKLPQYTNVFIHSSPTGSSTYVVEKPNEWIVDSGPSTKNIAECLVTVCLVMNEFIFTINKPLGLNLSINKNNILDRINELIIDPVTLV